MQENLGSSDGAHRVARRASEHAKSEQAKEPPKPLSPLQQFRRDKIAAGDGTIQSGAENGPDNPITFEVACERSEPEGLRGRRYDPTQCWW